ncbi:VOC family protein [Caulobacter sp. NIBR2454]|uniref:VOC family protein n=1 Tax=Caulobacter sp. NIBR2454 TaxID=3015996 RepID=UPI0022B65169|nr:VOC family protein [Caulobacter sp. NIBR2454]
MISYITIGADDLDKAMAFYDPVLGALGNKRLWVQGTWAGYGPEGDSHGKVLLCAPHDEQPARAGNGIMIGFHAETDEQVNAFHAAALANGGTCEGEPGERGEFGYLAYVRDPTGNKLSAFRRPKG